MKFLSLLILLLSTYYSLAQISGNINYQSRVDYWNKNTSVGHPSNLNLYAGVKGMANVKADSYVAIFSVTQTAKTTEEVNELIDKRINQSIQPFLNREGVEIYTDMVSFIPLYEYEIEKKIFSKNTYVEIPAGFEVGKNIHIKFKEIDMLEEIISVFAANEVYNLVRVDYFSERMDEIKEELRKEAIAVMKKKLADYDQLLADNLDSSDKSLNDAYQVFLPVEMYKSYEAYSNSSLYSSKGKNIDELRKARTLYYQPVVDKEFDFVINPVIVEPVIQILYEIKLFVKREPAPTVNRDILLLTPSGELKDLGLKK